MRMMQPSRRMGPTRSRGVRWGLHQAFPAQRSGASRPSLSIHLHMMKVRRNAHQRQHKADRDILSWLETLLDDPTHITTHYPAATQVRDQMGIAKFQKLERHRKRLLTFAVHMRKLDREGLDVDPATLDPAMYKMFRWIEQAYGPDKFSDFIDLHERVRAGRLASFPIDYPVQTELNARFPMNVIKEMLLPKPYFWFLYNLYFPKAWRMTWAEQEAWAIGTLTTPAAVRFPVESTLLGPHGIPPNYCEVQSRALLEVFITIRRIFLPG